MGPTTGTYHDGRIVPDSPVDWPDGTRVDITPHPRAGEKIGLEESEWRDDPESLADWEAWLQTLEPLVFTPEEEAKIARFNEAMRQSNLEAVRRQMEEGSP